MALCSRLATVRHLTGSARGTLGLATLARAQIVQVQVQQGAAARITTTATTRTGTGTASPLSRCCSLSSWSRNSNFELGSAGARCGWTGLSSSSMDKKFASSSSSSSSSSSRNSSSSSSSITTHRPAPPDTLIDNPPRTPEDFIEVATKPRSWISYGYSTENQQEDRDTHGAMMFACISVGVVVFVFMFSYMPDRDYADWTHREAYLELARREKLGLEPVDKEFIPVERIVLPTEEELEGKRVYL